jgi:hypothetical protein
MDDSEYYEQFYKRQLFPLQKKDDLSQSTVIPWYLFLKFLLCAIQFIIAVNQQLYRGIYCWDFYSVPYNLSFILNISFTVRMDPADVTNRLA